MKISNITNQFISFQAAIIDSHVHRGAQQSLWNSKEFPTGKLDEFIKTPLDISVAGQKQTDNVIKVLVSSIDGLSWSEEQKKIIFAQGKNKYSLKPEEVEFSKNEYAANLDMINKFKQDNFYAVMAVCQPSKTNGSADTIRQLIKENPDTITGLKFHPQDLMLNADSSLYDDYLNLADEMKFPCLFHSQVNIDYAVNKESLNINWADPEYIYELAKRHPNVPVIMAHMGAGGDLAHKKAIRVLEQSVKNNDAKLYVDISWVDFNNDLPSENPQNIFFTDSSYINQNIAEANKELPISIADGIVLQRINKEQDAVVYIYQFSNVYLSETGTDYWIENASVNRHELLYELYKDPNSDAFLTTCFKEGYNVIYRYKRSSIN